MTEDQLENIPDTHLTLSEVNKAIEKGDLNSQIVNFLHTLGNNKPMAKGLLKRESEKALLWIGPMNFPLSELARCTGPEKNMEYVQSIESWERRVSAIVEKIKEGWEVPVLIINARPWPILSIRDGNHRYEALIRSGQEKYWCLFWFENKEEQELFVSKYKVPQKLIH
jgi:hypothetical protein